MLNGDPTVEENLAHFLEWVKCLSAKMNLPVTSMDSLSATRRYMKEQEAEG